MNRGLTGALSTSVVAALLAACGSPPPSLAPGAQFGSTESTSSAREMHDSKDKALLYISLANQNQIDIVTYPKGKLVASIPGIEGPEGLCSDAKGNVFVPSPDSGQIFEYAHGGTSPIATLSDSGNEPVDCSIDPFSGNLAVANFGLGSVGNVAIYEAATGGPTFYADPDLVHYEACAYDSSGNLFVVGYGGTASFGELPRSSVTFQNFTLPFPNPRGIKWDGTYLAIESLSATAPSIERISISGSSVELVQTVPISWKKKKKGFALMYFALNHKTLVGPFSSEVGLWPYPAGGNAQKVFRGYRSVQGVAISDAP